MHRTSDTYNAIRDEIIRGSLNPGEHLVEKDLCQRLGTTRGYVREALKLLGADGFVILNPGKGAAVAKISYQETKDLYELLTLLESKSVELASLHLTSADIEKLIEINTTLKACVHIDDRIAARKKWHEGNFEFHRIFADKSKNRELNALVESIRWRTFDFRYVFLFEPHFEFFFNQHDQLIEALKLRDPLKAKAIMENHVKKASEVVLRSLEKSLVF